MKLLILILLFAGSCSREPGSSSRSKLAIIDTIPTEILPYNIGVGADSIRVTGDTMFFYKGNITDTILLTFLPDAH